MLMNAKVSARVTGAETFIDGFVIDFTVYYDPKAGDEAKNMALTWLNSVLSPNTKIEILSVRDALGFDIDNSPIQKQNKK